MKKMIATIWILTLMLSTVSAQSGKTGEEVLKLDARRFAAMARNDLAELGRILADDLVYTHSTGNVENKKEFLAGLESGNLRYLSIESDENKVRVYGDTAIINGRARVRLSARGQEQAFTLRFIDVYVKRNGNWQMVAWQSSRLP
ncbi:MAG: nuclear transport factor 2 family protein [Acidobacteriota bacterium]